MDLRPKVLHVEHVHHALEVGPDVAQTIVVLAKVRENEVNGLHGVGGEAFREGDVRSVMADVGHHTVNGGQVVRHGGDAVLGRHVGVEHLQVLDSEGVHSCAHRQQSEQQRHTPRQDGNSTKTKINLVGDLD